MSDVTPTHHGSARLLASAPVPTLRAHLDTGGGRGLLAALERSPDEIIAAVTDAGLRGRGGAGFPTGLKWTSIVETARDEDLAVSLVVNGAEGEPGTDKDRALLTTNPYLVVEGLLIACHAVGAQRAYIGVKAGFHDVRQRLEQALAEMVAADWPCAGTVEVVAGPDAYLFGEETALLQVIEGDLPMPRHLRPYMNGLFTESATPSMALVNNVETLANVPLIAAHGSEWFRRLGTQDTPGTILCTVTGDVDAPGVYELPAGTPLRVLIREIAGAHDVQFVVSGVSNAVITPDMLDTPMDHASMTRAGTGLGSSGFVVYDTDHCVVAVVAALTEFLAIESCGQCTACKLGTGVLSDLLHRLDAGRATRTDLDGLVVWAAKVTDLARCSLPTGAQLMVASLLTDFRAEVVAHLDGPCSAGLDEVIPKIDVLDLDTGSVVYDPTYRRKQRDWTYVDENPPSALERSA